MFNRFKKHPEKVKVEEDLEAKMSKIELFPGSLSEYERLKGAEYEIIDTPSNQKYLTGEIALFKCIKGDGELRDYSNILFKAVNIGADAIIRYSIVDSEDLLYNDMGIPVRKKQDSSND